MRVGLVTLGCDKNTVDNEYLAGLLEGAGCDVVFLSDVADGGALDAAVVTTCGFIGDAKKQSVESLVALAERKKEAGSPKRLFVAGCLAQRYAEDLLEEIPEIDGLVGVGQFHKLTSMILAGSPGRRQNAKAVPAVEIEQFMRRKRSDDTAHAFLKVSDGCNHTCTFCSIPLMKGRHRSVRPPILLEEARALLDQGVKELVLVAQDLSDYGKDFGRGYRLPDLLKDLAALDGDFWIRCMYLYPVGVTDAFIEMMATEPKVVPYIDMPLQHLDPEMLRRMRRPSREANTVEVIARLRAAVPDVAIRTTMIVGFPGETRQAHLTMLDGMKALQFTWLGAFQYSPEEGTPAEAMAGQVAKATKQRRWDAVMATQALLTESWTRARVGTRTRVLIERFDESRGCWMGRSVYEAPEVDGAIYVGGDATLAPGTFVDAEIVEAEVYDVHAVACEIGAAVSG
jgi:ribosomal protein S12 methylthiotransferase